jgi:hypothetical protein
MGVSRVLRECACDGFLHPADHPAVPWDEDPLPRAEDIIPFAIPFYSHTVNHFEGVELALGERVDCGPRERCVAEG